MHPIPLMHSAVVSIGGGDNTGRPGARGGGRPERSEKEIELDLAAMAADGISLAILTGGEPTLRRDLPRLIKATREARLSVGLVTNGRALVYPQLRRRLLSAGLRYLRVELYSPEAASHDRLVGAEGAFEQTTAGLAGLLCEAGNELHVDVACLLSQVSLHKLEALTDFVAGLERRAALTLRFVAPVEPLGGELAASHAEVRAQLAALLSRADPRGTDARLLFEGYPPCFLWEHSHLIDEWLRREVPLYGPEELAPALPREPADSRSHPAPCRDCHLLGVCPGAPARLLADAGEAALRPRRWVRPEALGFEFVDTFCGGRPPAGGDAICARVEREAPGRSLLLARDGGVDHYRVACPEATEREIALVTDSLEQLYIYTADDSVAGAPALRRLRRGEECPHCAHRPSCRSVVEVEPGPPLERELRWLRKELSRAIGRVLDVSAVCPPYLNELAGSVGAGNLELHSLAPDEARCAAWGDVATFHPGPLERFEWRAHYFDYLLAYHTLAQVADMGRFLAGAAELLRPDGLLYLCGTGPYGLLGASGSELPVHEARRNDWTSSQVVELMRRYPFRLDVHRPVNAQTSCLWLIKAMRLRVS